MSSSSSPPIGDMIALFDAAYNEIDKVIFLSQTTDVSQGRLPDGADRFEFFILPTPGLAELHAAGDDDHDVHPGARKGRPSGRSSRPRPTMFRRGLEDPIRASMTRLAAVLSGRRAAWASNGARATSR